MTILRDNDLVLRPFASGDAAALVTHLNNKKIYDMTVNIPYPYSQTDATTWIERNLAITPAKVMVIVYKNSVVGSISITPLDDGEAEIGYWLAEPFWGKGLMARAIRLFLPYVRDAFSFTRIIGYTFAHNTQSQAVLAKAGFKKMPLQHRLLRKFGEPFPIDEIPYQYNIP